MARRKKRGDAHVRLYGWFMKTPAWQSLPAGPRALLVELYGLWDGANNGQLFLSVREAATRLHVSPNTVASWFDMLLDRGFIKVAQRGAFSMKIRNATTWILTEHPIGGALPTKEFARWRPADDERKPISRRGGFRWKGSTRPQGEIQKPVSNIDTDGIKDCVKDADLSPPKQGSRYQTLTPSKPIPGADGINVCYTDKLPSRATSSERSMPVMPSPNIPSSSPAHENGADDAIGKKVAE
jgi:hypothetical protein